MINKNKIEVIDVHLHLPWQDEYNTISKKHEYLKK